MPDVYLEPSVYPPATRRIQLRSTADTHTPHFRCSHHASPFLRGCLFIRPALSPRASLRFVYTLRVQPKLTELAGKAKVTLPDTPELLLRKLEAADQAGCAEAVKLAGDDPRAAMRKINEIAEKAGISLMPSGMRRRFGGRDAAEKSAAAPPQMRENPMARLRELQRQYPEEMKQIAELRKSDPKKANEMLRDLEVRSKEEAVAK